MIQNVNIGFVWLRLNLLFKNLMTDGEKTDLSHSSWDDIHVIAGVLKLYFRLLPIPLIVFQVYPLIMAAASKHHLDKLN